MEKTKEKACGIVLVLVSGVLVLMSFLAVTFAGTVRLAGVRAAARADRSFADHSAESGLQYAAARLVAAGGYPPLSATIANRSDDWTYRDPSWTLLAHSVNPSYSHGEHWTDVAGDAIYDPTADTLADWMDLNDDGWFTAWSGRVRGGKRFGFPFALKIESAGGRIPVNAGSLSDKDLYGWDSLYYSTFGPNGTPDHQDLTLPYHVSLARVLNNLGAIRLSLNPAIGREDHPAGLPGAPGEPIQTSLLGNHVLENRPAGGYRSINQIRQVLEALGYNGSECDAVLPFLGLEVRETAVETGRPAAGGMGSGVSSFDGQTLPYAPIALADAPREVLQAVWRYVAATPSWETSSSVSLDTVPYGSNGIRAGGGAAFSGNNSGMDSGTAKFMIYPDEAEALADWAITFRKGPDRFSWLAFREALVARQQTIFEKEHTMLAVTDPQAAADWVRAKADLAFFAATLDGPSVATPASWMHWGIDHGLGPSPGFPRPFAGIAPHNFTVAPSPKANGNWYQNDPLSPYFYYLDSPYSNRYACQPQGFTLAPSFRFHIGSRSKEQEISGTLRTAEILEFTSQEDFENFEGGTALQARRGIRPVDPNPDDRRPPEGDPTGNVLGGPPVNPPPRYPWTVTLPAWNVRGVLPSPALRYSRSTGALALAGRACGPQRAIQYWPFTEGDFTSVPLPPELAYTFPSPAGMGSGINPWSFGGTYTSTKSTPVPDFVFPWTLDPCIQSFSIAMWMNPRGSAESSLVISNGEIGQSNYVPGQMAFRAIPLNEPTRLKTNFRFTLNSWKTAPSPLPAQYDLLDADLSFPLVANTTPLGMHHAVFVIDRSPADVTRASLYIDGRFVTSENLPPGSEKLIPSARIDSLQISNLDEIRFYPGALDASQVGKLYDLGRFVVPTSAEPAVFHSPVYDLGERGLLRDAHWTGLPAGEPDGGERVTIRVRVQGFSDPDGTAPTGPPQLLPDTRTLVDLASLGPVRSFRYDVEFVGSSNNLPLYKTPFFESIWFTMQGRGRTPRWVE